MFVDDDDPAKPDFGSYLERVAHAGCAAVAGCLRDQGEADDAVSLRRGARALLEHPE